MTEKKEDYSIYAAPLPELMEQYEAMSVEAAPLLEGLEAVKQEIVRRVKQRGESVEHGKVRATFRAGYTRTSWDSKGLEGYAVAHPKIRELSKETKVSSSVSVKVTA